MYAFEKIEGENCQISYIDKIKLNNISLRGFEAPDAGFWLVSSKNVSVSFREKDDLETYDDKRFQFVLPIALNWLKVLSSKHPESVEMIKKRLSKDTLVGCYVGNPSS